MRLIHRWIQIMKGNMKPGLLLLFLMLPAWLMAQPVIKEYKGRYINGMSHPAEAEYEYYEHPRTGEPVMHGRFKYSVRETEGEEKFSQNFRGMYADGLKTGSWNYRTSLRDYNRYDDGQYMTGNVTLTAQYDKGLPQGRWEYAWSMKSRERIVVDGTKKWSRYTETHKLSIVVTFNKGMLVDSVRVTDTDGTSIYGIFDSKGFFHQDWVFLTDSTEEISSYDHGVLIGHSLRRLDAERFETNEVLSSNQKKLSQLRAALPKGKTALANLPFTADTVSIFGRTSHPVRSLVIERIYSDKDFLYRYIPGDLNYVFDDSRKYFKINMSGGYLVTFTVKLTTSEQSRLNTLRALRNEVTDLKRKTEMITKSKELPPNLKNAVNIVNYNNELAGAYNCLALKIAQAEKVVEGKEAALDCRMVSSIIDNVSDSMSKAQAFDAIIHELQKLKESSSQYYEEIRKYK